MAVNDNAKGSAAGQGGINSILPFDKTLQSGNQWMGIDDQVGKGSLGSRSTQADRYGQQKVVGDLFYGNSAGTISSKESNSGANEKDSSTAAQYGPGSPEWLYGTYGSRENMPKYGGGPAKVGSLVGAGKGATPNTDATGGNQYKRDMPTQPGQDLVQGTNMDRKEYTRPKAGIGKPGKMGQRM